MNPETDQNKQSQRLEAQDLTNNRRSTLAYSLFSPVCHEKLIHKHAIHTGSTKLPRTTDPWWLDPTHELLLQNTRRKQSPTCKTSSCSSYNLQNERERGRRRRRKRNALSQQRAETFSTMKIDQEPLPDLRCWKPKASYRIGAWQEKTLNKCRSAVTAFHHHLFLLEKTHPERERTHIFFPQTGQQTFYQKPMLGRLCVELISIAAQTFGNGQLDLGAFGHDFQLGDAILFNMHVSIVALPFTADRDSGNNKPLCQSEQNTDDGRRWNKPQHECIADYHLDRLLACLPQ